MHHEIRLAVRTLVRDRIFSLSVIVILAAGIGAATAIFGVTDTVLLKNLPFERPEQLTWAWALAQDSSQTVFSLPEFLDYSEQNNAFDKLSALTGLSLSVAGSGNAERVQGARVSGNFFEMLGAGTVIGRALNAADDASSAPAVAVLSHGYWVRRFGEDRQAIGRTITLNGTGYEIVGVLPREFPAFLPDLEVFVPLAPEKDPWRKQRNSVNFLRIIGRMKPGLTIRQAEQDLNRVAARMREAFPVEYANDMGVRLVPLHERFAEAHGQTLLMLFGGAVLLLLIACANLAGLLSARTIRKSREHSVRVALGASRSQILRQVGVEIVLLAAAGGLLGSFLSIWGIQALVALSPPGLPRIAEMGLNIRVLAFSVMVTAAVAALCGLIPAWNAARADIIEGLKDGSRASAGKRKLFIRNSLVVAQLAIAVLLIGVSSMLIRSLRQLQRVDPGYEIEGVLTARLSLAAALYPDRAATTLFYERLSEKLRSLPGVRSAGSTSILPMTNPVATVNFNVPGLNISREERPISTIRMISPGYFETMRVPLVRGRMFDEHDNANSRPVAIINRTIAEQFFGSADPVGSRLLIEDNPDGERSVEIVGVAGDVKHYRLDDKPSFDIYIPQRQVHAAAVTWLRANQFWVLKTDSEPMAAAGAFRTALSSVDPNVAIAVVQPMETYFRGTLAARRFTLSLLALFSAAALALALTGMYASLSYWTAERTREIGIRLTLGAKVPALLRWIVARGISLACAGVAIGIPLLLIITPAIRGLLFGVSPADPMSALLTIGLVLLSAVAAAYIPARRAVRVDPIEVLKAER